jgi:hypothetical protein
VIWDALVFNDDKLVSLTVSTPLFECFLCGFGLSIGVEAVFVG